MATDKKVFRLAGKVQHYDWGGLNFIPSLLNIENNSRQPFAEYWLGAHDTAPSEVEISEIEFLSLNRLISSNPELFLGKTVANQFKRLPYLLKILDVRKMLSIQVHPSKENAESEFARENEEQIPLNSSNRNYKDDNHKPELMVALGDFWLLHGFKSPEKLINVLQTIPELESLLLHFEKSSYKNLYQLIMEMSQHDVNNLLDPLLKRIIPLYHQQKLEKDNEDFWAAMAALTFNQPGKMDRGIFSIYFFNLVQLKKGQAIYQSAGVPHAYLEGQNVEIMANSDNVLRGGLTTKHIDVKELMKHIKFEPVVPDIIQSKSVHFRNTFKTPATDFELSMADMKAGESIPVIANTTAIIFVMKGSIELKPKNENALLLQKGQSAVVFADAEVEIIAHENAEWYLASVPEDVM